MDEEIRQTLLNLLHQHRIMTLATVLPNGWPQATVVGYVNEGLTIYFLCGLGSQLAANLARDGRVSLTIDHDIQDLLETIGLSMAAHAQPVGDRVEAERVLQMFSRKYSGQIASPGPMPIPEDVRIFRVIPTLISILDYAGGVWHTDLVAC